jgi:hypothetical protein
MTTPQSVESWIDAVAKLWRLSYDGKQLTSFLIIEKNEMPAAVVADMAPCVISYPVSCEPEYSLGGPTKLYWTGESDFHLTKDVKPANLVSILPFYGRIFAAAAASMQLGGKVFSFRIPRDPQAIRLVSFEGPQAKPDHQGLIVKWQVEQHVSGQYTIGA